jgi:hypothetical protein
VEQARPQKLPPANARHFDPVPWHSASVAHAPHSATDCAWMQKPAVVSQVMGGVHWLSFWHDWRGLHCPWSQM